MTTSTKTHFTRAARSALSMTVLAAAVAGACMPVFAADAAPAAPAATTPIPQAAVEALNKIAGGPHPGYRANHAKGVLVMGTFTPTAEAATLSKAPHLNGTKPVPVIMRFSNGTGFPNLNDADGKASPHGIAIRFKFPDGTSTDIVSISANGFPVATPEEFVSLLQAIGQSGPGVAKPTPVEKFMSTHPIALKWATTPRPAPVSFGTLAFYGVNAFKFTNAKGQTRFARYQILPVAGEAALTADETAKASPNYLMDELPARIAKAPVKFRLVAQLAEEGDPVNDGSLVWPATRKLLELGTFSLTASSENQAKDQKALLFNPLTLTDGIEPSNDPILLIRPAAYARSYVQRLN